MLLRDKLTTQHVMQMAPGPEARSDLRFAAELLSVIVGDDSGSRLFWELVDPGYAESADLSYSEYDGTGAWMSYLSCNPEEAAQNLERCLKVFADVNANGVTADELEQARNKAASRIVLRGERPMGRLSSLGGNWMYRGNYRSITDDLKAIRNVTLRDIREVLEKFPISMTTTVGVGPLEKL